MFTRTARLFVWWAVVLLSAGVLVGIASAREASAAPYCPTMQVFGVRGSGETSDDAGGYGTTVKASVDRIKALVPTAAFTPIDYPAVPVKLWKPSYYIGGSSYTSSVQQGTAALTNAIRRFVAGPCGTTTHVYLAGYSQGAHVVGDAFQGVGVTNPMTDAERARVAGVAMIADPKFRGAQGSPVAVGDYAANRNGIATVGRGAAPRVVTQTTVVRSYCGGDDVVCNFSAENAALQQAAGSSAPHLNYMYRSPTPSSPSYTSLAATFLVARWKSVGPTPPLTGPRTRVLLYGNYSSNEGRVNIANSLVAAGYTVDVADALPTDLSGYGQVWWYGLQQSVEDQQAMVAYAKSGGSIYISGEWSQCGCNQVQTKNVVESLVLTVGGLRFGPDLATGTDTAFVNAGALDGLAKSPNTLTTYTSDAIGTIDPYGIGGQHLVFREAGNVYGTVAAWDNRDVYGGGRLLVNMDVNWAEPSYGADPTRIGPMTSNFAYFLSGATSRPAKVSTPVIVTADAPTPGNPSVR